MTTWDERKRRSNLAKHGVDLALAERFDWLTAVIEEDDSEPYGEQREVATGWIDSVLYIYVYTVRNEQDHAISLRKARPKDYRDYGRKYLSSHRK
jgi:uncharacterized DUF497 family protein